MIDIIIIGAGAAGMTAALYARRNGKSVLILEKESVGGQIANSPRVENLPGIKQISGMDFSDNLYEQITALGAEFEPEEVVSVQKNGDLFTVTTDSTAYECKAVIVATGVKQRHTGVDGEDELIGRGVSYCALCDGAFYAGEEVALIGDANSALQYALLLSNYCKKVTVLTLFDKFFAEDYLVQSLNARGNIESKHNLSLKAFKSDDDGLTGLVFDDKETGKTFEFPTRAVFVAIGHIPDNERYSKLAALDGSGYFDSDENCRTKTPGLFVAGDCRAKKIRQLATATADGAVASTNACMYVDTLK